MKKLIYCLFIITLSLAFYACEDKEEIPRASLKIAPAGIWLPQEGGSQIVAVITNQDHVLARGYDADWCHVEIDGKKMTVEVQPNTGRWVRSTDIVVVAGEENNLVKKVITVEQEVAALNYRITIPTDFSSGEVQKVMDGDVQVAEICREYVPMLSEQKRVTVIYPMVSEGKADLTKGYIADNGGALQWDLTTRGYTYTLGSTETRPAHVYMIGSRFTVTSESSNEVATTLVPYTINDGDGNAYRVVKIGTQYWTDANLRTTKYIDGTPITRGISAQEWTAATDGLYNWFTKAGIVDAGSSEELQKLYGAYYNWYAAGSGKLAPKGWRVPTDDPGGTFWGPGGDFYYLMLFLQNGKYWKTMGAKLKSDKTALQGNTPDYSAGEWSYGNEEVRGTNISGFGAIPSGFYYTPESAYYQWGTYTMFWSATSLTSDSQKVMVRALRYDSSEITFFTRPKNCGFYIRLVRE